jgi:hypothetical protein
LKIHPTPRTEASTGPHGAALAAALVGLGALALYAASSSRFVGSGDVAEFQALASTGGIAHSGYPLYVLALRACAHLPFGAIAQRAAWPGALAAALTVALAAWHGARVSGRTWIGVATAAALALACGIWRDASRAEIYAFSLLPAAGLFLAAIRWSRRPSAVAAFVAGVFLGCGLVSHLGVLGIATPVVLLVVARTWRGRAPVSHWAVAAAGTLVAVLPSLLYLLAQDRAGTPMNYLADTFGALRPHAGLGERLARVARLLSAGQYFRGAGVAFRPFANTPERLRMLAADLALNEVSVIGVALALVGAVRLLRRRDAEAWLTLGWAGAQLFWLALAAYADTVASFFLAPLFAIAALQAHGLAALRGRSWLAAASAAVLLVGLAAARARMPGTPGPIAGHPVLAAAWAAGPASIAEAQRDSSWEQYAHQLLGTLGPQAIVLACWNEGTPLRFAHLVERRRPDVEVRWRCHDPEGLRADVAAGAREDRPVYATYDPVEALTPGMSARRLRTWPQGGLWLIVPANMPTPPAGR